MNNHRTHVVVLMSVMAGVSELGDGGGVYNGGDMGDRGCVDEGRCVVGVVVDHIVLRGDGVASVPEDAGLGYCHQGA